MQCSGLLFLWSLRRLLHVILRKKSAIWPQRHAIGLPGWTGLPYNWNSSRRQGYALHILQMASYISRGQIEACDLVSPFSVPAHLLANTCIFKPPFSAALSDASYANLNHAQTTFALNRPEEQLANHGFCILQIVPDIDYLSGRSCAVGFRTTKGRVSSRVPSSSSMLPVERSKLLRFQRLRWRASPSKVFFQTLCFHQEPLCDWSI